MEGYKASTTGRKALTGGAAGGLISLLVIKVIAPKAMDFLFGFGIAIDEDTLTSFLIGNVCSGWVGFVNWWKFIWRGKVRPWIVKKGLLPEIKQKNEVKV